MDPKTLQLVLFIEQMVALAAKSVVDLKGVLAGDKTADEALADADANYQAIIDGRS